ncbi:hypothetical protein [Mycoplasma sp. ATU-Cv-703]|uniref:hypothetical protein n=1 Tax=Mycoplasma sp. ATU-Cv-703 TaxID=2498595 RepID=UPI001374B6AA
MLKPLELISISRVFNEVFAAKPTRVRLFNFTQGVLRFDLSDESKKQTVGSYETTWIRVWDEFDKYYDFLASSVFFVASQKGLLLMCSEDLKYVDIQYISHLIRSYADRDPRLVKSALASDIFSSYYSAIQKEIQLANRRLTDLSKQSALQAEQRLDVEDAYEQARNSLVRHYLLDVMIRRIIRENRTLLQEELA